MTETKPKNKPLAEPLAGTVEAKTKNLLNEQPKVRIRLYQVPKDSSDEQMDDVPVQVNGYVFMLQRGVSHDVPETVADILSESGHI
jgi:hypothetical protein